MPSTDSYDVNLTVMVRSPSRCTIMYGSDSNTYCCPLLRLVVLLQQLKDEERLDGRGQPSGLDGDEQVAPLHEAVEIPNAGEPAERARERQLGTMPALEGDGQAHHEEDLPVHRQDDDPVRLEQLCQPAHRWMVRASEQREVAFRARVGD